MRTGFAEYCPAGRGLFDYATRAEALAAIDAIGRDYAGHSRAAREIAAECFGNRQVIGELLGGVGL